MPLLPAFCGFDARATELLKTSDSTVTSKTIVISIFFIFFLSLILFVTFEDFPFPLLLPNYSAGITSVDLGYIG
jgi:hypothetical protein